jgi:hypothetical protein
MLKIFLSITLMSILFSNCGKENNSACDDTTSLFSQLYCDLTFNTLSDGIKVGGYSQSYTFTLSEDKELSQIGYQSPSNVSNGMYDISIFDSQNSSLIYGQSHYFSDSEITYITLSQPLTLVANNFYEISRGQVNGTLPDSLGRGAVGSLNFPYTKGVLTITNSKYRSNNSIPTEGIPFIDLIFKD